MLFGQVGAWGLRCEVLLIRVALGQIGGLPCPRLAARRLWSSAPDTLLNMLSRHATMGLLLLRATASLAWTPAAVRLHRSARAGGNGCRRCPAAPSAASSSRSSSSSRVRSLATATSTPAGEAVGGEDTEKEGSESEIGGQDAAVASAQVDGGVEIQLLLQRHMEVLGSAGRKK